MDILAYTKTSVFGYTVHIKRKYTTSIHSNIQFHEVVYFVVARPRACARVRTTLGVLASLAPGRRALRVAVNGKGPSSGLGKWASIINQVQTPPP